MTPLQLAIYVALFGAEPCSPDYHHCHGTPVAYEHPLFVRQDSDDQPQRSEPVSRPDPVDPPARCD